LHLRLRLRPACARTQPPHHANPVEALQTHARIVERLDRPPELRLASHHESEKTGRGDADDGQGRVVDRDLPSHYLRIGTEAATPISKTEARPGWAVGQIAAPLG